MYEDDEDTIPADPDYEEGVGLTSMGTTDGHTPDENREVGIGVEDD